ALITEEVPEVVGLRMMPTGADSGPEIPEAGPLLEKEGALIHRGRWAFFGKGTTGFGERSRNLNLIRVFFQIKGRKPREDVLQKLFDGLRLKTASSQKLWQIVQILDHLLSEEALRSKTFRLDRELLSMDEVVVDPAITIKAIGHQWYWSAPLHEGDLSATKCLKVEYSSQSIWLTGNLPFPSSRDFSNYSMARNGELIEVIRPIP
ncbi:Cytochrome c oxidase subunit 2 mitochondrial, partial [Bienertia sinuspersici]